jgi:hypothetical protein
MMDRRRFLKAAARAGSALLIVPVASFAACSDSKDQTGTTDPPVDGLRFTSDVAGIHTHDFLIAMDNLTAPADGGVQGPTTISLSHKHIVRLTQDDLARIQAGATLNKATSIVDGHTHNFKFSLSTAQPLRSTPDASSPDASSADA